MKLPLKITLLLFAIITIFVAILSWYSYRLVENNFSKQSRNILDQNASAIETRLRSDEQRLNTEMEQLSKNLFVENEATLAALLSERPSYTADVVAFAEKLRRRTTFDFLYVISRDGMLLSNSLEPAAFGKMDPRADFPADSTSYVFDGGTRREIKKKVQFGRHELWLRGGHFFAKTFENVLQGDTQLSIKEFPPGTEPDDSINHGSLIWIREILDYKQNQVAEIRLLISDRQLQLQKQTLIKNSSILVAGTLLLCLGIGYFFSFTMSRPVRRLRDAAIEMSKGNLGSRVTGRGSGEVGELMRAFNEMAQQLEENQKKLIQTERIAAWQEIARHLAHEIKNPLTPIKTSIANLRYCLENAPERFNEIFPEASESIVEEVEKLKHLADEFARFARLPAPELRTGNLNEVIQKALKLYEGRIPPEPLNGTPNGQGVRIEFDPGDIPLCRFDAGQVSEVVHNLIQNGVDAVGANGIIKISTELRKISEHPWICVTVEDNGAGMTEQIQRQAFLPYFTTKNNGTGLGLAIVQRIVTDHGGSIGVRSEAGVGTKFEIQLPSGE